MLSEKIRAYRKAKGLSQQELADQLHVVRQTVSKWEQGLSVPDADLLIALSGALETPVSSLLGEENPPEQTQSDSLRQLGQKLEEINLQLARQKTRRRMALRGLLAALFVGTAAGLGLLFRLGSPYLGWEYSDPETAVLGTAFHSLEWGFVRAAPLVLIGSAAGLFLTRRK